MLVKYIMHLNIWRHKFVENHKFVEVWKIVTLMPQICDSTVTKIMTILWHQSHNFPHFHKFMIFHKFVPSDV